MKKNKKVLIVLGILLIVLAGCVQYRDSSGELIPDMIIKLDTPWNSGNDTWFGNLFVWPLAQILNIFSIYIGPFWSITVVTLLITLLTLKSTMKSTEQQAKIQEIQPELNRIQEKYKNMPGDNKNARMMMAQEQQKVYAKYGIKPTAGMGGLLLQLPIMIAMYQAVARAYGIVDGTVLGQPLEITPMQGFQQFNWVIIIIYVLMLIAQAASSFLPQYFAKQKAKKRPNQAKAAGPNMNSMLIMTLGMIGYFGLIWPVGMSLYYMISSLARVAQTVYVNVINTK